MTEHRTFNQEPSLGSAYVDVTVDGKTVALRKLEQSFFAEV